MGRNSARSKIAITIITVAVLATFILYCYSHSFPKKPAAKPIQAGSLVERPNTSDANADSHSGAAASEVWLSSIPTVQEAIVGTWQSEVDSKDMVIFNRDGTQTEMYDGIQVGGIGKWNLASTLKDTPFGGFPTGIYLTESHAELAEPTYYSVSMNSTRLLLTVLGRGTTNTYRRAK